MQAPDSKKTLEHERERDNRADASFDKSTGEAAAPARRPRGFAAMDPRRVSQIASKGGKAAHRAGTAHEFTSEEARVAGRKGGTAHGKRRPSNDEGSGEGTPH